MNDWKPPMSDEAVKAKTGKDWSEWFAILDAAGAQKMNHKQIVAYLSTTHGVGSWWQQMVTNTYEQGRGLRDKHEMPEGYQISRSKTLDVPLEKLYAAWEDEGQRAGWLPDPGFTIRKATPNKNLRVTWVDRKTSLDVSFSGKGTGRTQVTVQHNKLPDAEQAEQMKAYWGAALDRLEQMLTGS